MIARLIAGLASRARRLALQCRGVRFEGPAWLRNIEVPHQPKRIRLAAGVALDRGVTLLVSGPKGSNIAIRIGRNVYINRHTIIDSSDRIEIGNDCMIGPFCYLTDHDHSPGPDGTPASGLLVSRPVVIEAGAWIGAHVTVLKGVRIGQGAIVGAGSVLTRDVPPFTTVVGNPAHVLPARTRHT